MKRTLLSGNVTLKVPPEKNIDVLLAEYAALKAEETESERAQMQIATALFSFIAAIVGLNFFFQKSKSIPVETSKYMILGFCPLLIFFFGCLWMYQLYCQMRFGAYIYHLEADINKYCAENEQKIYFEHWIALQDEGKSFFKRTSRLYGYITLGTWIASPWLLLIFAKGFFPDWGIFAFYNSEWLLTGFLIIVTGVYYYVQFVYVKTILNLKSEKNLQKPRIQ